MYIHSILYYSICIIYICTMFICVYLRYGVDHVQAHLHGVPGVVGARLRQPGHAVVAVAQDLDAQTLVLLDGQIAYQYWDQGSYQGS